MSPRSIGKIRSVASVSGRSNECFVRASNPAITALVRLLRDYMRADLCVLILVDAESGSPISYESSPEAAALGRHTIAVDAIAEQAINRSGDVLVVNGHRDRKTDHLASLFGDNALISVPVGAAQATIGRLYFVSRGRPYYRSDALSAQCASRLAAEILQQLQRLERLHSEAAKDERLRVSRDLHDSTIQPYLGLKLGLEALRRQLANQHDGRADVDELITMADEGISELRNYVGTLRDADTPQRRAQPLLPALNVLARKFSEYQGIETHVIAEQDVTLPTAMHTEVMHIAREALSNIRRHTAAKQAAIYMEWRDEELVLEFVNHNSELKGGEATFRPASISERTAELGGAVRVRHIDDYTTVAVHLPCVLSS